MKHITPCLWFDTEGEEAAEFYTSVFPNSKIVDISHYGSAGPRDEGTVMTVNFELNGQPFITLNGGPDFTFNEAVSLEVICEDQDEVDHYWEALTEGGEEGPCGWLKDRFGLSWQIVPRRLYELLSRLPISSLRPMKMAARTTVQSTPVPTSGATTVTRARSSASKSAP